MSINNDISDTARNGNVSQHDDESPAYRSNWLSSAIYDDLQSAFFSETLVTYFCDKEVGKLSVAITNTRRENDAEDSIFVRASSEGVIDNIPCGTTLAAFISQSGVLLEQRQQEYSQIEDKPLKREIVITREHDRYTAVRTVEHGEEFQQNSHHFSFEEMKDVITEGHGLLLHRIIAKKGLPLEGLNVRTFDSDLVLCPVRYTLLESVVEVVGDREQHLVVLERTLNPNSDQSSTRKIYLTKDGHMVRREQPGSSIEARLVDFAALTPNEAEDPDTYRKPVFEKVPLNWEEDMEMQSKFIDRKEALKAEHATYMRKHPELQALVADFLQHLLFRRPDNVLASASEYFSTFDARPRNGSTFARSGKI